MDQFVCLPGGSVAGEIQVPGDKSISHRSVIFGSIANGVSRISGFLQGEDSLNTVAAFRSMGVEIERDQDRLVIQGAGLNGLSSPAEDLQMGNSGTAMRLLLGLLAGQDFDSVLLGDESLSKRPMNRVIDPLSVMGAKISAEAGGRAPLRISGKADLQGIDYDIPVASAQIKSCLLLAGLYARGDTLLREPATTRDHSERMLRGFGCEVDSEGGEIRLRGGQSLQACDIEVPADISSAAFFMVAASIAEDSQLLLRHVGVNPTRTGVIDILRLMGADIKLINQREVGGEVVADIEVRSARLRGIDIPEELVPLAIDEFPVLFIAAACATGVTRLTGASELRVKESDRIQAMADGLAILGVEAQPAEDGICIQGGQIRGGEVDSLGDHRIAMAFSIASLRATDEIRINNCSNVNTSFPGFVPLARQTGIRITGNE